MKKFFILFATLLCFPLFLSACAKQVDYSRYVSERRSEIYLYRDDSLSLTINCVCREQPYNADGICGEGCDLVEVFVKFKKNPQTAQISISSFSGEMNYEAVKDGFSIVFSSAPFSSDGVDCTLTFDDTTSSFCALPVKDKGVISSDEALSIAVENSPQTFQNLQSNGNFLGEISIRLIYDDACYYYVGVCDRQSKVTAFLIDGSSGRVISTKNYSIFSNAMRSV